MAKRPDRSTEPLDIFASSRFAEAMARSTEELSVEPAGQARVEPLVVPTPDAEPKSPSPMDVPETKQVSAAPRRSKKKEEAAFSRGEMPRPMVIREANVSLKFRVPYDLRAQFQTFKAELSSTLGTLLDDSNLARPYLELLVSDFRERILEVAETRRGMLRRPGHGDTVAMAEFDEALAEIIRDAVRRRRSVNRSPSSRSDE